jgi:hypothetical protein
MRKSGIISPIDDDSPEEIWGEQSTAKNITDTQPFSENSNVFEDTEGLFVDPTISEGSQSSNSSDIIDTWDKMNIKMYSNQVNIEFGDMWRQIESIHLRTKHGYLTTHDFDTSSVNPSLSKHINDSYTWKTSADHFPDDYLVDITIRDLSGDQHTIYKKD